MEYPFKKMRFSMQEPKSDYLYIPGADGQPSSPKMASFVKDTDVVRPWFPAPTAEEEIHREKLFGRSNRPRRPPIHRRNAAAIVPRAPEVTIFATAVNVIVNDPSSMVASTVIPQWYGLEPTVVSIPSFGHFTYTAEPKPSVSPSSPQSPTSVPPGGTGSTQIIISSPPPSPAPTQSSFTTTPSSSRPLSSQGLNSTTTQFFSGRTTTITKTSTLNVTYLNGTFVPTYETATTTDSDTATATATGTVTASSTDLDTGTSTDSSSFATVTTSGTVPLGSSTSGGNAPGSATSGVGEGVASGASVTNGSPPVATSSSSSSANPASSDSAGPSTPTVVGGVVGGVAGLAIVLVLLLILLRMYRRRLNARGQLPGQVVASSAPGTAGGDARPATEMSQRSSGVPFAIFASPFKWFRPESSQTSTTTATAHTASTEPERGFQRVAGRKIAPVLQSGGDEYGGNYGAFEKETAAGPSNAGAGAPATFGATMGAAGLGAGLSRPRSKDDVSTQGGARDLAGSSFYRDSEGFYGGSDGSGRQTPTELVPPLPLPFAHDTRDFASASTVESEPSSLREVSPEGVAVIRPSPARTPIASSPSPSTSRLPIQGAGRPNISMADDVPPTPPLPPRIARAIGTPRSSRDGIGRSLASQDGSRGGRFTESV